MIHCPNIYDPGWKALVAKYGQDKAYLAYFRHGSIPPVEKVPEILRPKAGKIDVKPEEISAIEAMKSMAGTAAAGAPTPGRLGSIVQRITGMRPTWLKQAGDYFAVRPERTVFEASPSAKKALPVFRQADEDYRRLQGDWNADLWRGQKGLSRADRQWIKENFKQAFENGERMPNPRIQRFADAIGSIGDKGAKLATELQVRVKDPKTGQMRPFEAIANHFPHILTPDAREALIRQSGPLYDALVEAAKTKGFDLAPYIDEVNLRNVERKAGSVDYARTADLPDSVKGADGKTYQVLETDPFSVYPRQIQRVARRLANIKNFGRQGEQAKWFNNLRAAVSKEAGTDAAKAIEWPWQHQQGTVQDWLMSGMPPELGKLGRAAEGFASGLMLSGAEIRHHAIKGWLAPFVRYGATPTLRAGIETAYEGAARHLGLTTRVTPIIERIERGGGFSKDTLSYITEAEGLTGKASAISKWISNHIGMSNFIQRQQNKILARSGELAFFDALGDLKAGRAVKATRDMLGSEFDWTPAEIDRIVKNGPTAGDLARVSQRATTKGTAYMESALTKPPAYGNAFWKRVLRFTSVQRSLGWLLTDSLHAAKAGRYGPLTRLLLGAPLAGEAGKLAYQHLAGKAEKDEDFAVRLMDDFLESGVTGLPGAEAKNIYYSAKLRRPFGTFPQADFYAQLGGGLMQALKKGYEDGTIEGGDQAYKELVKRVPIFRMMNHLVGGPDPSAGREGSGWGRGRGRGR